jgi:transposase
MANTAYQQLRDHLAYLRLPAIAERLAPALEHAAQHQPGYTEFLRDLLAAEVASGVPPPTCSPWSPRCSRSRCCGSATGPRGVPGAGKLSLVVSRPSKLTPAVQQRIVTLIREGNYRETAVQAAGVGLTTFYRWMEIGETDAEDGRHSPYREFREAVQKALADAEVADIALIETAARNGSWQAAAWRLERMHAGRWGRNNRVDVEHRG